MKTINFDFKNLRYERKFYIEDLQFPEVDAVVKAHPFIFSEIFSPRSINNIYFDNCHLESYFDAVDGHAHRIKVRIRWYGDLFGTITRPILELKIKINHCSSKISFPLKIFNVDTHLSIDRVRKTFDESDIPEILKIPLKGLEFSLLNRYQRKYFLSANQRYRLTIDNQLESYQLAPFDNHYLKSSKDDQTCILELKYDQSDWMNVDEITKAFPFRMTKSSKYVSGVERTLF